MSSAPSPYFTSVRVDGFGNEAERRRRGLRGIEGERLPQHRRRRDAAAAIGLGEREASELLFEQRRFVAQRRGHLIQVGHAEIRLARALLDHVHRLHDGRALRRQNRGRLEHALHEPHDVFHGPADGAATRFLLGHRAFEVLRVVAHHRRLLADFRATSVDCCWVAVAVCCTIFVTSSMAAVAAALPRACSSVARAISEIEFVERSVSSRILSSTCAARAVSPTPSATRSALIVICSAARPTPRCTFWISVRISSVDTDVRSERSRISSATTANPRPALAGLRGDDRRVQREEVRLSGDLVDDAHDLADLLRAFGEIAQRHLRFLDRDLDLAHAVDRAFDGRAPFVRGIGDIARELRRLSRRVADFAGRRVHLHHRRRGLRGERREALGVARHLVDRSDHLFDRRGSLLDELGERVGDAAYFFDRRRHFQDRRGSLFGIRRELFHAAADAVDGLIDLHDRRGGRLGGIELCRRATGQHARAAADLIAGARNVSGELAEAADRPLEVGHERAQGRGGASRLRVRDDLRRGEREIAGGDAVDQLDDAFTAGEHAFQPDLEQKDAECARADAAQHDLPPEREIHLRHEGEQHGKENDADQDQKPHLL